MAEKREKTSPIRAANLFGGAKTGLFVVGFSNRRIFAMLESGEFVLTTPRKKKSKANRYRRKSDLNRIAINTTKTVSNATILITFSFKCNVFLIEFNFD
jgi:hypothetical protein